MIRFQFCIIQQFQYNSFQKQSFIQYVQTLNLNKLIHSSLPYSSSRLTLPKTIKISKINTFSKVLTMNQITLSNHHFTDQSLINYYQPEEQLKTPFIFEKQGYLGPLDNRRQLIWKIQEKIKHLAFIYYVEFPAEKVEGRSMWQIYKKMATFIKTKNPNQCRIYHKRSIQKYKTIYNFISEIRKEVPELKKILSVYKEQLFGIQVKVSQEIADEALRTKQEKNSKNTRNIQKIDQQQIQIPKIGSQLCSNNNIQEENQKLDYLKTNVTLQEKDVKQSFQRKSFQLPLTLQQPLFFYPFQSFQLTHSNFQQNNFQLFADNSYPTPFKFISSKPSISVEKKRLMLQCHQLFMAYTQKLAQFMNLQ